jgi:hypothetical protein
MKNRLMVFAGLSIVLSAWLVLAHAHLSESGSLKTVTLRIEGMT